MWRGIIAWNEVSDYCLERGVGLLPESRREIVARNGIIAWNGVWDLLSGIIAWNEVWDYCPEWGVGLLPGMRCVIIA